MAQEFNMGVSVLSPIAMLYPVTVPYAGPWSDVADLPFLPRAVHVSVTGNVKYDAGGVTLTEVLEVGWHPFRPTRIYLTGTAATLVVWR